MKKTLRKMWSAVLVMAMLLTGFALPESCKGARAAEQVFTLYYYSEGEPTLYMNIWNHAGITFAAGAETSSDWGWDHPQGILKPVEDNKGWYSIKVTVLNASADDGFDIYNGGSDDANKAATYDNQWNNVGDYKVLTGGTKNAYAVKDKTVYTDLEAAGLKVTGGTEPSQPTVEPVESDLYVQRISNMSDDFIRGADISSVYAEYQSGVKYYDFLGKELPFSSETGEKTFFDFLKECGQNWVRIRVWNNPFDVDGNGYGGGNNDIRTAKLIGKAATDAGLKVLIDFHYSDFWADPNMQAAPKAWKDFDLAQKTDAVRKFTTQSLTELLDAGVDVCMVQVGNETNNGLCGETTNENVCVVMNAGSSAIRELSKSKNKEIQVAIHYTDVQNDGYYDTVAKMLSDNKVDYDVFATSYYPFWHGTTDNLTSVLKKIVDTYGKKVMVAETSYAYTLDDGDGHENNVKKGADGLVFNYSTNVQGQTNAVADVMRSVCNIGSAGIGVFYWEPAWIPVKVYDPAASDAADVLASNKQSWEKNGSGWASSFSKEYDPGNAGIWYGGSSWDNQAMFDFTGKPLESFNVYKYVLTGTTAAAKLESVSDVSISFTSDQDWKMPETVPAKYTDNSVKEVAVSWTESEVAEAKAGGVGKYTIHGKVSADGVSSDVICTLEIKQPNLLKNPGFEEEDMSPWIITVTSGGADCAGRVADSNKRTGDYSLKYWSEEPVNFSAEQKVTLNKGVYELSAYNQGAVSDNGENAVYQLYAVINGKEYTVNSSVTSWQNWENPTISSLTVTEDNTTITVGVRTSVNAGGWGAWDDFYLRKTGEVQDNGKEPEPPAGKDPVTVKPKKVTGVSAKPAKKSMTVKWKKAANATGYQVQYATTKKFKKAKSVTVKTRSKKIKGLKSKKTYYVRVRAYAKNGSKKTYGAYSKIVKAKTK